MNGGKIAIPGVQQLVYDRSALARSIREGKWLAGVALAHFLDTNITTPSLT
jgi:hypothetical protein